MGATPSISGSASNQNRVFVTTGLRVRRFTNAYEWLSRNVLPACEEALSVPAPVHFARAFIFA